MNESLSFPEIIKRSKSTTLHPKLKLETKSIKQIGDYTLGPELGSGAFGKVVLGKHTLTGESVAIKILDKLILSETPEDYELVKQEISILKIVKHKYIVQLYEILQTPQHIYIIMEYCEGKDLMDYILCKHRLSELEALKFFQQLINALFYLHSQNIAHRDVKIDNMLLDKNKNLKLVDFGLSTKYSDEDLLDQPCGTVVYAAPEVLDGNEYHGMLADVWSSGIVLYGMVSGYLPFSDKDDEVNKRDVLEGKIDIPEFFSPLLQDLLKHMLDINPITRYTLQEIKQHPWFNLSKVNLIPGIIIGYNTIPIDENILNLCVAYNADRNKVEKSVKENKYDRGSSLYYLLVRKIVKKGFQSISDLSSEGFINFIMNDDNNLLNTKNTRRKNSDREISRNKAKDSESNNYIYLECFSSSSRNMENLGAAPRLLPLENNNNNKEKKEEKEKILITKNKRKKISSSIKDNKNNGKKYSTKYSGDLCTKKPFIYNKNQIKIKNIKNAQRRVNNSANLRTKYIKKVNLDKNDNKNLAYLRDESAKSKPTRNDGNALLFNESCPLEFKSGTEKIERETKNIKLKNKNEEKKTQIKNYKKYLKQSTFEIYKKNSKKEKAKNKKNNNVIKIKNEKDLMLKSQKNKKKEKLEGFSGNSCVNIKTNNNLKTPYKINNSKINNSILNSHKNIYNIERNINQKIHERKVNLLNTLNTSISDKLTNLQNYTNNRPTKNASKSIQTMYNRKYIESKSQKKDESRIIFSSNKKRDHSVYHKKNNITTYLNFNHEKLKTVGPLKENNMYDSSKLFLTDKKKKLNMNSLDLSLNKSTIYANQLNNQIYPAEIKKKKQTEYVIDNTIYEFNNKKNKNRIRLDYNPNKLYELTNGDENKKKNRLNKSVTVGKTEEKIKTGLSIYMNNFKYDRKRIKKINLESSILNNRKIHGNTIRELSCSPNQKYIDEKTIKERIPLKYQKKSIDSKLTTETIYNKYLNKNNNKNPLNPNGNKKIKFKPKNKNISNGNNIILNNTTLNLVNQQNTQIKGKEKEKRRLSQERRGRRINNHQKDKSNSIRNIKEKNKLSTKKLNSSISTKNQLGAIEYLFTKKNNNFKVFDLSCLVIKDNTMKECNQNLVNKLKKNGFNIICNRINEIKCSKNRMNCEIEICNIKYDYSDKNIFCYKVNNKRAETQMNKAMIKIIS